MQIVRTSLSPELEEDQSGTRYSTNFFTSCSESTTMRTIYALAVLCFAMAVSIDDGCTPESCWVVRCAQQTPETCPNGVIKVKGGFCGCCDACLDKILEGEDCSATRPCEKPVSSACEPGTTCKRCNNSWTCQR